MRDYTLLVALDSSYVITTEFEADVKVAIDEGEDVIIVIAGHSYYIEILGVQA